MAEIVGSRFVIAVPDLEKSLAFYRDVLGFEIEEIDDPGWRFYHGGGCTIMAGECPDAIPPSELGDHSYFAYINVRGIDEYYEFVKQNAATRGMEIGRPVNKPWKMREFNVTTVDGHRIMFGEVIE